MGDTLIDWADVVWNPITGCSKISPGCDHCYAERMAKRLAGRAGYRQDDPFKVTYHDGRLYIPMDWRSPRRVFVNSMGDLFHSDVEDGWIDDVMDLIIGDPQHTFMILTKRPARMREYFQRLYEDGWISVDDGPAKEHHEPIPNLWLGVTVEGRDQMWRVGQLLATRAALRFVSGEPLLGPLDFSVAKLPSGATCHPFKIEEGHYPKSGWVGPLRWVIVGGETGPGARPMHLNWARGIRDQCQAAGVPFFLKQCGEWQEDWGHASHVLYADGRFRQAIYGDPDVWQKRLAVPMARVGKEVAGYLLDGQEWRQFPEVPRG